MTREMGPGARHAMLDDHWGGWNWMKLVTLGERVSNYSNLCLSNIYLPS